MSITNALNIAKTGLQLQETNIAVKSQNLASQGVDSYKRQYLLAQDIGYQDISQAGASSSQSTSTTLGLPIGMGVKAAGIYRSFEKGDVINTDDPYDIMVNGNGFYQVLLPDGTTGYTRTATFRPNAPLGGQLTTVEGYPLQPTITIPSDTIAVQISEDGQVQVEQSSAQGTFTTLGQLQLATFINPNGLKALGKNIFLETTASGTANLGNPGTNGLGGIMQGFREASNVNAVEEITDLIKIQHAYEHLTKVISTSDAMSDAAVRMGR